MYSYEELVKMKNEGMQMDWNSITKIQLEKLFVEERISDSLIADLYKVSKNQVRYKRKKWNIAPFSSNYIFKRYKEENSTLFESLNSGAKSRLFKSENIDWISKAFTHYFFRNGPVEDMHANGQLSQEDMKTLNKYMVNRIAGLLKLINDGEWIKIELMLNLLQYYGKDWDKAVYDNSEIEFIFRDALQLKPNCILMNKNTEVLIADYDDILHGFSEIYEIKNIEYAPLIVKHAYYNAPSESDFKRSLSDWFCGRGIPSWRDDLDILLHKLNVNVSEELLNKAFGLSLSDQYWIKPYDSKIKYEDINFFEHDFKDSSLMDITFSNVRNEDVSLFSPNNTTDGRLKKTWILESGKRFLLKGGFKGEVMQPFNEALASLICERLCFDHVKYTIDVVKGQIVSKCPCFIDSNTEYVSAYQIVHCYCKKENIYEEYIEVLKEHGISKARESIENMFILDYLILNEDRHLNNFGIIRDVNTLKWICVAPIFDNGQALNIVDYNEEEIIINGKARFFYSVNDFDSLLKNIENITRFDLTKLDGVVEEFETMLHKFQDITKMTDRRIHTLCTLLFTRIENFKKIIAASKDKSNKIAI